MGGRTGGVIPLSHEPPGAPATAARGAPGMPRAAPWPQAWISPQRSAASVSSAWLAACSFCLTL